MLNYSISIDIIGNKHKTYPKARKDKEMQHFSREKPLIPFAI
jgi:hypothetical protein